MINFSLKNKISRSRLRIIISIVIICPLLLLAGWRIYICKKIYDSCSEIISYNGGHLPRQLNSVKDIQGKNIDFGYCKFTLPAKKINSIQAHKNGWMVTIKCNEFTLNMVRPVNNNPRIFEKFFLGKNKNVLNNAKKTLMTLNDISRSKPNNEKLMPQILADYRWQRFVLDTKPKSFTELFFSSTPELTLYSIKMLSRGNCFGQRGIGLLQTNSVKAIVYLGNLSNRYSRIMASVWSDNGKISHTIFVISKSYDLSEQVMKQVLSSLKYTLDDLPAEKEINKIIVEKVKLYEKTGKIISQR